MLTIDLPYDKKTLPLQLSVPATNLNVIRAHAVDTIDVTPLI